MDGKRRVHCTIDIAFPVLEALQNLTTRCTENEMLTTFHLMISDLANNFLFPFTSQGTLCLGAFS